MYKHTISMAKSSAYILRSIDKRKIVVVSEVDHDAVRLFARKNHMTIVESAHRLLEIAFVVVTKRLSEYK